MRRHDDRYRASTHGRSRHSSGPYDQRGEQHWRIKAIDKPTQDGDHSSSVTPSATKHQNHVSRRSNIKSGVADKVSGPESHVSRTNDDDVLRESTHTGTAPDPKHLASKIVTPSADDAIWKSYVTTRDKGVAISLCFSHEDGQDVDGEDQMIGALNDMDNMDNHGEDVLNDDDLLGQEAHMFAADDMAEDLMSLWAFSLRSLSSSVGVLQVNDQSPAPGMMEVLDSTLGKGH
ncbi:unnamed protein product [Eruca vesicaria subsp. sativa]|uniref:Uncharacterized protein n=1 Tax=Eruca vesicaria subsp. sativa TaxID=29727 RepID=A0ABC8K0D3_ERUVS|nr:unnamed protein product [Eruca vesicaria subsp. sativa]